MGNKCGIKALHHALKILTCRRTWRTLLIYKMCCIPKFLNQLTIVSISKNKKNFHTRNISAWLGICLGWLYSLRRYLWMFEQNEYTIMMIKTSHPRIMGWKNRNRYHLFKYLCHTEIMHYFYIRVYLLIEKILVNQHSFCNTILSYPI